VAGLPEVKLPQCCSRKQNAIRMEAGDVISVVRKLARRPESVQLQQDLEEAKESKRRAVESFELHVNDESLEHK
jgi:hypothetical protein